MKKLKYLIIHCTATPEGRAVTSGDIYTMHTAPPPYGRGWDRVGYSDMIHLDGSIENLTPYNDDEFVQNDEMTWGVAGKNSISRHVVYVGGVDAEGNEKDTRTQQQEFALIRYIGRAIAKHPDILIAGHNQFANKACPSFNVPNWLQKIGVPEKNIYSKKW